MIVYFPTPYEDELLYSLMLRYHVHLASTSRMQTMLELFNNDKKCSIVDFPNSLDYLVEQIPSKPSDFTAEYLIQKHTIVPFYKPFLTPIKYTQVIESMKKNIQKNRVKLHLGEIDASRREKNIYLCRGCIVEQKKRHGEFYINRVHQIPGVFVCTKHKELLVKYSYTLYAQQKLTVIDEERLEEQKLDLLEKEQVMKWLFRIAEDIEWLMTSPLEPQVCEFYLKKYQTLIDIKGISYPRSEKRRKFKSSLLDFFPSELFSLLKFDIQKVSYPNWMRYIFGSESQYLHPLKHFLLIYYLCGSIQDFFEKEYTFEPFGKGPWICMNPFANHYLDHCIHNIEYSIDKTKLVLKADFKCECGFTYRLFSPENNPLAVKRFSMRIVSLGPVWREKVKKLIEEGVPRKMLIERSGMSRETFNKKISDFEKTEVESRDKKRSRNKIENFDEVRKEHRRQWMKLVELHPDYSRKQLNKSNSKLYRWMMTYDKAWTEDHAPKAIQNTGWNKQSLEERDRIMLEKAKKLINEWYQYENENKKLKRITINSIAKAMDGEWTNLYINAELYPLTNEYIKSVVESNDEFRKRKFLYFLQTEFKDREVTYSKIKYVAGLYKNINKELQEYIYQQITIHNEKLK
ncbi:TnsD family Tn7-like transposition protein [Bacillus multifaciens]|uniref:TnsD family Tn7-like transposition protein n=1 Tax=Bacillus multifaciens TaxID=3068506 RepID=UPI002741B402|nr:TnsD family Tn7-like transposition protein [Bacillus sp. WLY-B-L8]MDP7981245.1 TnsD family Tn7-like transposition protein [Bacillus sp. WLY-B-L8]